MFSNVPYHEKYVKNIYWNNMLLPNIFEAELDFLFFIFIKRTRYFSTKKKLSYPTKHPSIWVKMSYKDIMVLLLKLYTKFCNIKNGKKNKWKIKHQHRNIKFIKWGNNGKHSKNTNQNLTQCWNLEAQTIVVTVKDIINPSADKAYLFFLMAANEKKILFYVYACYDNLGHGKNIHLMPQI